MMPARWHRHSAFLAARTSARTGREEMNSLAYLDWGEAVPACLPGLAGGDTVGKGQCCLFPAECKG